MTFVLYIFLLSSLSHFIGKRKRAGLLYVYLRYLPLYVVSCLLDLIDLSLYLSCNIL